LPGFTTREYTGVYHCRENKLNPGTSLSVN
jgi:hypothetical protein